MRDLPTRPVPQRAAAGQAVPSHLDADQSTFRRTLREDILDFGQQRLLGATFERATEIFVQQVVELAHHLVAQIQLTDLTASTRRWAGRSGLAIACHVAHQLGVKPGFCHRRLKSSTRLDASFAESFDNRGGIRRAELVDVEVSQGVLDELLLVVGQGPTPQPL